MGDQDEKNGRPEEPGDLKEAARAWGPFEGELIKNFLESHGIPVVIRGRAAPFVYPLTVDGLAEFKVLVRNSDLEKAKELLAARPASDGPEEGGEQS